MRKNSKNILIIMLITVLSVFSLVNIILPKKTEIRINYKKKKQKNTNNSISIENIKKYENIVFLGDSITEYNPISSIYFDLPIVNSGVSGYKTTDILERMESMVYVYNPTSVYILIGTNDIMYEDGNQEEQEEKVVNNIKEIVERIKENRSKAIIYIQSIYPVNYKLNPELVRDRTNEKIMRMNDKIEEYCNSNNCTYINMYDLLLDSDGNFSSKYTNDGLHPNDLGYARISQVIVKYIYNIK